MQDGDKTADANTTHLCSYGEPLVLLFGQPYICRCSRRLNRLKGLSVVSETGFVDVNGLTSVARLLTQSIRGPFRF